jgi:hypothetical protein
MQRLCFLLSAVLVSSFAAAQDGWNALGEVAMRPESWHGQSVELGSADGRLVARHAESGNGFALPRNARFRREISVEATVLMQQRLLTTGWNFAGVTLSQDAANFWMIALVEGPDGAHSVDFIECHNGIWQAQNAPGTALRRTGNPYYDWQAGTAYRLQLVAHADRIVGTVLDASGTKRLAEASFAFANGPVVRGGMAGLILRGSEAAFSGFAARSPAMPTTTPGVKIMDGKLGRIALFEGPLANADDQSTTLLATELAQRGFGVTPLTADQITTPGTLSAANFHILVIPNCTSFPGAAGDLVLQFAREGGHVMFIGGPFLDSPLFKIGDKWLDHAAFQALLRDTSISHRPFPIGPSLDLSGWSRACRDRESASDFRVVSEGPEGKPCIRLDVAEFGGWDGRLSPKQDHLFGEGDDLFLLVAKGDARTSQLAVEIQETDGSRWIATAELATDWQRIPLTTSQFHYWHDSPTKNERGQADDQLNPANAARISLGFASTHTPAVGGGTHTVWIADLGSGTNPVGTVSTQKANLTSTIPTIYPRYKVFPLNGPAALELLPSPLNASQVDDAPLAGLGEPESLVCGIPRTMGTGFDRDHKWRFIPLVKATATDGSGREGFCEWLVVNQELPFAGVAFAGLGYTAPGQWNSPAFQRRVGDIAAFLRQGTLLDDAGTEHMAYWPGEAVRLGAKIRSFATGRPAPQLKLEIRTGNKVLWQRTENPAPNGDTTVVESNWQPPQEPGVYTFSAALVGDGAHDTIEHEFAVLDPNPAPKSEFITAHDGDFWLKGEQWYPVGINYWPLYVSGMDHGDYWAGWLRDRYYEPALVEQDLVHMADMGINMVSIQSPPTEYYRNLLDFARRCANHGIHINLYNGLASPLGFNEKGLQEYLTVARLPGNPVVFAYDTIWEPGNHVFRNDDARGKWDGEWRAWIDERYGSIGNAEKDWQYKARRNDQGEVISPPDRFFREDGDWRIMMAAYRRFMDDLTSRLWGKAHRRLRELDPNHLISYRQGNTLPYDFALSGTSKHIDFICPEGYAVPHSDTGENAIGFITRYVEHTTAGKPVIWSEFGKSVWDGQRMAPNPKAIEMVGEYHARFYRTALASGTNGTAPWWWPGGYRVGERSDFGVVGPDRSERPAAKLIREYAPRYKTPRPKPTPTAWLTYDRDAHAGGYCWTAFHEGADAYRDAADDGKLLGIRTKGTGTDSTNTPLVAVGNVPCNGHNPPKYLNAEFNSLQIQSADGTWVEAVDDATIPVRANQPIRARASLGNLQEAAWVPGTSKGSVALVVRMGGKQLASVPMSSPVPYLADADFGEFTLLPGVAGATPLTVRLEAIGRTPFGEARGFSLSVQGR